MRIMAIGDPHGSSKIKEIPIKNIDLFLINGDIGKADIMRNYTFKHIKDKKSWVYLEPKEVVKDAYLEAYNSTIDILNYLAEKAPVYLVFGNVENKDSEIRKLSKKIGVELPLLEEKLKTMKNIHVINNKKVKLDNLVIGGSEYFVETNWVKTFAPDSKRKMKQAIKDTKKAEKFYSKLGYVDILLAHQPPYGILDKVTNPNAPEAWKGKNAGSKIILDYIKKQKPRFVFCGHIHEGMGRQKIGNTEIINLGSAGGYAIVEVD